MASLVKPGGKIILYFLEQEEKEGKCFYLVGSEMFFSLPLSKDSVVKSIEDAGFFDVQLTFLPRKQVNNPHPNLAFFFFLSATKK